MLCDGLKFNLKIMKLLLATEKVIVYRSQFEKEQDEGLMDIIQWIVSTVYNHPWLCFTFVLLLVALCAFLTKKKF